MQGIVHIECTLKNPAGKWERDQKVEFPSAAHGKLATLQIYGALRATDLVSQIDDSTVEIIPFERVEKVRLELKTVTLADNLDLAAATSKLVAG